MSHTVHRLFELLFGTSCILMLVLIVFGLARAVCAPWRQSVCLVQHRD